MQQSGYENANTNSRMMIWVDWENHKISVTPRDRWEMLTFDRELLYVLKIADLIEQGYIFV